MWMFLRPPANDCVDSGAQQQEDWAENNQGPHSLPSILFSNGYMIRG